MMQGFNNDAAFQEDDASQRGDVVEDPEETAQEVAKEIKKKQTQMERETLLNAIRTLDPQQVEQCLKEIHFDLTSPKATDYIMEAIRCDQKDSDNKKLSVLKVLEHAGILFTVPEHSEAGNLPIHEAAQVDSVLLLDYCASFFLSDPFNVVNKEGDTPLHIAARFGSINVVLHIRSKLGDEAFAELARFRNEARLTSFDLVCEKSVDYLAGKLKGESWKEYVVRTAKDAMDRHKRRDEIQRLFVNANIFLVPIVFYHRDCLEHLAMPTAMQRDAQNNNEEAAPAGKKKKKKNSDFVDAWESPLRLNAIMAYLIPLEKQGRIRLVQEFPSADRATLELAHSRDYVDFVHRLSAELAGTGSVVTYTPRVQAAMQHIASEDIKKDNVSDTHFSEGTLKAALRSAGAVCAAIDSVMKNESRRTFCVVRPPGHHAGRNGLLDEATSCGFCVFNNVMVGAMYALDKYKLGKIAIVDLDVHHGNGTEEICREFQRSLPPGSPPKFLFLSTHLYDDTRAMNDDSVPGVSYSFYPGSGDALDLPHNIVNFPFKPLWRKHRTGSTEARDFLERTYEEKWGRTEFRRVIAEQVLPPLRAFHPDLILVSAGFDAADGDLGNSRKILEVQLGGFDLKEHDFSWVASEIAKIAEVCCEGRLVSVLEGGYGRSVDYGDKKAVERASQSVTDHAQTVMEFFQPDEAKKSVVPGGKVGGRGRNQTGLPIDRDALANNVKAFIEGLCGGLLPSSPPQPKKKSGDSEEDSDDWDTNNIGDEQDEEEFAKTEQGLLSEVSRRSDRVKRQRADEEAASLSKKKSRGGRRIDDSEDAYKYLDYEEDEYRANAVKYLKKVKDLGESDYRQFTGVLLNYRNKTMNATAVAAAVKVLFADRPDLIAGFNVFLAPSLRIKM